MLRTLTERTLCVAVPTGHPLARGEFIDAADLNGQQWIAGSGEDRVLGVWPGLDERPQIAHTARDWLAKLQLVAAGFGLTTVPPVLTPRCRPGCASCRCAAGRWNGDACCSRAFRRPRRIPPPGWPTRCGPPRPRRAYRSSRSVTVADRGRTGPGRPLVAQAAGRTR
ncbi:hypothetical protein GCM10027614_04330 [Micromonospora vulcania]